MAKFKTARNFKDEIEGLIAMGKTNPEIATELGLTINQVALFAQRELGGNPNYLKKKTKHAHLHEEILKLRLKLSDAEIREKLGLTHGEMKSCMTYAYQREEFKHLRVETRRRDPWSSEELRFLLRWAGVITRKEINEHLGRGKNEIVIKEKLQELGLCSKNVNGLTFSQFRALFKRDPIFYLSTSAGSPASKFSEYANWKIVPWCHISEMIKDGEISYTSALHIQVEAMAMFQRWVHGDDYWRSLTSKPVFKKRGRS